jgi:hypothetical protein
MSRRNPFSAQPTMFTTKPPATVEPPNLSVASLDLYRVVQRLVWNDGRMTTDDFNAARDALRLAERPHDLPS